MMRDKIISTLRSHAVVGDSDLSEIAASIEAAISDRGNDSQSLIIVANKGIHAFDESRFPAGEVFYASQGNIGGDPLNPADLKSDLQQIVKSVAAKLKSGHYRTIYVVPSGFPIISQMIVATIIQVAAAPPVVLQYDRETGDYWPISLEIRKLISES